jgi:hypothetical protein
MQDMGAEDKLPATLDTHASVDLARDRKAVLVDTVVQQLPSAPGHLPRNPRRSLQAEVPGVPFCQQAWHFR